MKDVVNSHGVFVKKKIMTGRILQDINLELPIQLQFSNRMRKSTQYLFYLLKSKMNWSSQIVQTFLMKLYLTGYMGQP